MENKEVREGELMQATVGWCSRACRSSGKRTAEMLTAFNGCCCCCGLSVSDHYSCCLALGPVVCRAPGPFRVGAPASKKCCHIACCFHHCFLWPVSCVQAGTTCQA
jgi:hypothetical protein